MHSKGNHKQDEKPTLRMRENICKRSNCQKIYLQNFQKAHTVQYQINKQPNEKWKKWAGDLNRDFSNDIQMPNTTWKDAQHD